MCLDEKTKQNKTKQKTTIVVALDKFVIGQTKCLGVIHVIDENSTYMTNCIDIMISTLYAETKELQHMYKHLRDQQVLR